MKKSLLSLLAILSLIKITNLLMVSGQLFEYSWMLHRVVLPSVWQKVIVSLLAVTSGIFFSFYLRKAAKPRLLLKSNITITLLLLLAFISSIGNTNFSFLRSYAFGMISIGDFFHLLWYHAVYDKPYIIFYIIIYLLSVYVSFRKRYWVFHFFTSSILFSIYLSFIPFNRFQLLIENNFAFIIVLFILLMLGALKKIRISAYHIFLICLLLQNFNLLIFESRITKGGNLPIGLVVFQLVFLGLVIFVHKIFLGDAELNIIYFWLYFCYLLMSVHFPGTSSLCQLFSYSSLSLIYLYEPLLLTLLLAVGIKHLPSVLKRKTIFYCFTFLLVGFYILNTLAYLNYETWFDWKLIGMTTDITLVLKSVDGLPFLLLLGGTIVLVIIFVANVLMSYLFPMIQKATDHFDRKGMVVILVLMPIANFIVFPQTNKNRMGPVTNFFASLPLFHSYSSEVYSAELFEEKRQSLNFPKLDSVVKAEIAESDKLNVVFILMESSYNKYLSHFGCEEMTQPYTKKFLDRMELFPNFYSNFPNSFHAEFNSFTSIYAPEQYVSQTNPRIECATIFDILQSHSWQTSFFYSSFRNYANLWDFLRGRGIELFYDESNMPVKTQKVSWGVSETDTVGSLNKQIELYAKSKTPFFLTYMPVSPHRPFDGTPEPHQVFERTVESFVNGDVTAPYLNSLVYMDYLISTIIAKLEDEGLLDSTLIVITNDHGEWVEERMGHGFDVDPELTNCPLIVMDPRNKGYKVNYTLGSQVDIMPTILDLLNIPLPKDKIIQGQSLYKKQSGDTRVYLGSGRERGFVENGKYYRETSSGWLKFCIDFEGTRTLFTPDNNYLPEDQNYHKNLLDEFEGFQNSLIHNYSHYLDMLYSEKRD